MVCGGRAGRSARKIRPWIPFWKNFPGRGLTPTPNRQKLKFSVNSLSVLVWGLTKTQESIKLNLQIKYIGLDVFNFAQPFHPANHTVLNKTGSGYWVGRVIAIRINSKGIKK
jgi:hypothetical protein